MCRGPGSEAAPFDLREAFPDLVDRPDGEPTPQEDGVGHPQVPEGKGTRLKHGRRASGDEDYEEVSWPEAVDEPEGSVARREAPLIGKGVRPAEPPNPIRRDSDGRPIGEEDP